MLNTNLWREHDAKVKALKAKWPTLSARALNVLAENNILDKQSAKGINWLRRNKVGAKIAAELNAWSK